MERKPHGPLHILQQYLHGFFLQILSCHGIRSGSPLLTLVITVPCSAQVRLAGGCCCVWVPRNGGTSKPCRSFPEKMTGDDDRGCFRYALSEWSVHQHGKRDRAIDFRLFPSHFLHFPSHNHSSVLGKSWATHPSFHRYLSQLAHLYSTSDCPPSQPCLSQHPGGILPCRTCSLWKLIELDWSLPEHTASTLLTCYLKPVQLPGGRARTRGCLLCILWQWVPGKHRWRTSIRRPPGYPTMNPDLQGWARWQTRALTLKNKLKARLSYQPIRAPCNLAPGTASHFFPSFLFKAELSWNLEFEHKIPLKISKGTL